MQQRKIKPKTAQFEPPAPPSGRGRRALQARMLEGHSPATVMRLVGYVALYQAALLVVGVILFIVFQDWALKALDVVFFAAAILVPGTIVWPALILARRDRKATPELIQGQMVGASPVSTVYGLGMLYVNTRQNRVQLNIERRLLRSVPQNQVQVAVRVTPNLRHVQSLQVMGPRFGGSVPNEVPEKFRTAERFPLLAIAGAYGGVFGLGMILLVLPLYGSLLWLHLLLVPVGMAGAALIARYLTRFYQKRLEAALQP
jgi:hypothetical protein